MLFRLVIREPSLKAPANPALDVVLNPTRLAALLKDCMMPTSLPDTLFRVHGRELVACSSHLIVSQNFTKSQCQAVQAAACQ